VGIYIYKLISHTPHTHILCKHKLLFWKRLIVAHPYFAYWIYILMFNAGIAAI